MIGRNVKKLCAWAGTVLAAVSIAVTFIAPQSAAAQSQNGFSLQVSPSPLVATIKPGQTTELELKIRNTNTDPEELKIEPRKFTVNRTTGEVVIDDTEVPEIAPWIRFSPATFIAKPGEWTTEKVRISLPKESGFSYSLALVVSRTKNPAPLTATRSIQGSVAVFTLLNVDRPGAIRKLEIEKLSMSAGVYEYLPATVSMNFKNVGNTIVQPYGNIFIQRDAKDTQPLATLPVNDKKGYILPGNTRVLTADWGEGFPSYKTEVQADGTKKQVEVWDWSQVSKFRIGQYSTKVVAVYNDGQRDIPIEKEVTFWVLPWKIILAVVLVAAVLLFGVWTILRKVWLALRRTKHTKSDKSELTE